MKWLIVVIPVCVSFGPIFIVIGTVPSNFISAIIGAVMLSIGCTFLFKMLMNQEKKIAQLQQELKNIKIL